MSGLPGPETRWENHVSDFIDKLVDSDVRYIIVQEAIERLIQFRLSERIAINFAVIEEEIIDWHPMPPLFPNMRELHIFWTVDRDGGVTVIEVDFAR